MDEQTWVVEEVDGSAAGEDGSASSLSFSGASCPKTVSGIDCLG